MDGGRCRCAGNRSPGFAAEWHRVRHGGGRRRQAAARRQARIDALSEDERVFFDKQLDVLEPSWRETRKARLANIDEALDYAGTQLAALDRNIERRRVDIHETPGDGYARLLRAGFGRESRQGKVRALTAVETYLRKNFEQQEEKIRTDEEGEAFLRRGRVEVLETDRAPETLAERGRVLERAEAWRQATMAERKRQAAEQRVARLKRLFAVPGADKAFFTSLDARKPRWRERGTVPVDIDVALDMAEPRVDRRQPASAEHAVIVAAEQTFQDASSEDWRQAGEGFPQGSRHAHMSQRLSDRTRACALAAEREERPATPALVQRIFTWLRTQVDKLLERLGVVKPAPEPAQPVALAPTGHRSDAEEAREKSVSDREVAICTVPGGVGRLRAEEEKIHGGSGRPLSLEERESVASTVEDWIRAGVRADVERVIGETRAAVGFAPPVQIWRVVGRRLHDEREYIPGSRPGLLISTLRTLPDGTADVPPDEEQTLQAALDEQRRAENEERHQKALEEYQRHLENWKSTGRRWLRSSNWPKPKEPTKKDPDPPSQAQVEQFRVGLISRMVRIVRGRIEQMYDLQERARPLRPDEGAPKRSSMIAHDTPQRQQQPDRDDNGPSRW